MEEKNLQSIELDHKKIGFEFYLNRQNSDLTTEEIAEGLNLKKEEYENLENGNGKFTIELIKKGAKLFNKDPLHFLSHTSSHNFSDIENSTILNASTFHTFIGVNEKQNDAILKLINSVTDMNKKIFEIIEQK
ncbi:MULTISPECIES: helix-turn-helix transcriptional regulator [unclassified Sphingobacterium]|uniref:helix-turn-helix domain-containing protein n=1 Tax=unclassified Sphingobacterium TaxID=2609468 RepID=UPI00104C9787|nr:MULTISPECIES: helix-turn-helix transcriptional regulator [unclassified Sphingobacterium]MCS3556789.1 transcriptional regulator with XRE-family HTH domain [Sphingobacterium sp. JUb21]TCQ99285.1 hypothetical protein EDF66_11598 [Sphingobacterium sp. JUb20]